MTMDILLPNSIFICSEHFDERPFNVFEHPEKINLLVIHNISLPPATNETDFDNDYIERFFTGRLPKHDHPYFLHIAEMRVSAHILIKRQGEIVQFVPLDKRAWHAGKSNYKNNDNCNDFSIGIELQGTDDMPYSQQQYDSLIEVTKYIQALFPSITPDRIVGHEHVSPGRKTDPGACFDWFNYINSIV